VTGLGGGLDAVAELVEVGLVGDGVVQAVPVVVDADLGEFHLAFGDGDR